MALLAPMEAALGVTITALGHLVHALFPLPFLAVLLRMMGRRTNPSARWETVVDLPMALLSGLVFLVVSAFWVAPAIMVVSPLMASDFGQYCQSVGAFRSADLTEWVRQRSLVAGALPGVLSGSLGIIDGLLMGAWISYGVTGVGLFLWGRAAHSRMAGVVACLMGCAVHPLVYLTRTVSFYPEVIAASVLSMGLALLALRERRWPMFLAAGLAIGLVLLIDVRGLLFALPALLVVVLAVATAPRRQRWPGAGILLVCLVGSYPIGHQTTWPDSISLELQTLYYVDDALRNHSPGGADGGIKDRAVHLGSRYIWGRTGVHTVPATLQTLIRLQSALPDDISDVPRTASLRRSQVNPWVLSGWLGLLLAMWGLRRRRLLGLGFGVSILPAALALQAAAHVHAHVRYLANGLVLVPVLMGVGFAVLAQGALEPRDRSPEQRWLSGREWIGLSLVALIVVGGVPTWLSPHADWRVPMGVHHEPRSTLWHASAGPNMPLDVSRACARHLAQDFERGYPVGSRLLEWEMDESQPDAIDSQVHP